MPELSILEILKNTFNTLIESKVLVLFILEIAILLVSLIFSRLMNKRVVRITSITASIIILLFYIVNYIDTLIIFINNVSTKLVELIYFPTTLEFVSIMIISFIIMTFTLLNKKSGIIIKIINTTLPIGISFLFLGIIEYINKYNIAFDEFSVFTNPVLMSLYELAMSMFVVWIIGLIIYAVDMLVINRVTLPKKKTELSLVTVDLSSFEDEKIEDIELPKLKVRP